MSKDNASSNETIPSSATTWANFGRLLSFAKPYKLGFILAIVGMLGYAAVDVYFLSKLPPLIDEGLSGSNPEFMKWAPIFVIVAFFIRGIFHFVGNFCLAWVGNHVVADLRQKLFEHIMAMPVSFHDKESTGTLISKITFDTEQVLGSVSKAVVTMVQQGAFVLGLLIIMFYESWQLSAIFFIIMPAVAYIVTVVSKRFREVSKNIQGAMGEVTSVTEQTFNAHKVILTFDGQKRESKRFSKINQYNRNQRMKMVSAKSASVPIIQIIASFALAFVLFAATTDELKDNISAGTFIGVITYMTMLLRPLKLLTSVNSEFQKGMAACKSIFWVLDHPLEKDGGKIKLGRSKGQVSFKDVSFSYDKNFNASETSESEALALKNINLDVSPGETIALVGRSGSGKSTLSSILLRFYEVTKGQLLIDGHNIKDYCLKDLRHQFSYVSQQVVLFNDTLANNIAYSKPNATEEEIHEAAKNAHVIEFAKDMAEGLNTNIGDNGALLSGGQRQRVAIARALLCDAPFLILDEATSALDSESERHIQDALLKLQQDRTSFVIAHRLSTIENADKIVVMDKGKIIESGSHQSLLTQNGPYAKLHNAQFDS